MAVFEKACAIMKELVQEMFTRGTCFLRAVPLRNDRLQANDRVMSPLTCPETA
jgi:hypothetical protein